MNLTKTIEKYQKKNQQLRKQATTSKAFPDKELISFGGVNLHKDMDFSLFSDGDLLLGHTVAHTIFNTFKKKRSEATSIHANIVQEMEKRGKPHISFDKLDNNV